MIRSLALLLFVLAIPELAGAQEATKSDESDDKSAKVAPEATKADDVREITFDDLKFEIAKGAKFDRKMLGEKIESLNGKKVRLTGQILPASVYQQTGIRKFVLSYTNWRHCVSPLPSMIDSVNVEMVDDQSISFSTKPLAIEGTLEIRELPANTDRLHRLYHIKATSAKSDAVPDKSAPADPEAAKRAK